MLSIADRILCALMRAWHNALSAFSIHHCLCTFIQTLLARLLRRTLRAHARGSGGEDVRFTLNAHVQKPPIPTRTSTLNLNAASRTVRFLPLIAGLPKWKFGG